MKMMVFTPRTATRARARAGDDSVISDIFRYMFKITVISVVMHARVTFVIQQFKSSVR